MINDSFDPENTSLVVANEQELYLRIIGACVDSELDVFEIEDVHYLVKTQPYF